MKSLHHNIVVDPPKLPAINRAIDRLMSTKYQGALERTASDIMSAFAYDIARNIETQGGIFDTMYPMPMQSTIERRKRYNAKFGKNWPVDNFFWFTGKFKDSMYKLSRRRKPVNRIWKTTRNRFSLMPKVIINKDHFVIGISYRVKGWSYLMGPKGTSGDMMRRLFKPDKEWYNKITRFMIKRLKKNIGGVK